MVRRTTVSQYILFAAVAAAVSSACAARQTPHADASADRPAVVASLVLPRSSAPEWERFAGLSGLARDVRTGTWLTVADDRDAPRWYSIRVTLDGGQLAVVPGPAVRPQMPPEDVGGPVLTDFEAVALTWDSQLLIACEGDFITGARRAASLLKYARDGRYLGPVNLPEKFLPARDGQPVRGLRNNRGFEGLTLDAAGRSGWALTEGPLLQDGDPADITNGSKARLVEIVSEAGTYRIGREFVYPVAPFGRLPGMPAGAVVIDQTPSEMTTLPDGRVLVMERGFARDRTTGWRANTIRIFQVVVGRADDVSGVESLRDAPNATPVEKILIADLSDLTASLPDELRALENFEAMAPGPPLNDGRQTLLLGTDDNYSESQVTAFVVLALPRVLGTRF